jgi:hypothetical protein
MARAAGLAYYAIDTPELDEQDTDTAILSRYPIEEVETLTHIVGMDSALRARLRAPDGQALNVFVVHLASHSTYDHRMCETERLASQLALYQGQRNLLLGDHNFMVSSKEGTFWNDLGWTVAGALNVDQIRVGPGMRWGSGELFAFDAELAQDASDHPPVGVQVDFFSPADGPLPAVFVPTPVPALEAPAKLAEFLEGAQALWGEDFGRDKFCYVDQWRLSDYSNVRNGQVMLLGSPKEDGLQARVGHGPGTGVLARVRFSEDAEARLALTLRDGKNAYHHVFGLDLKSLKLSPAVYQNRRIFSAGSLQGTLKPQAGVWYDLLLAVGPEARMLVLLWNSDDPSQALWLQPRLPTAWRGDQWLLKILVSQGQVDVDAVREVRFEGMK